mmetsp:Transcript_20238/g.40975  ORF Transcript_20238/g.40975 Transcript_20238/m.40975 type:complete len:320 (+) Transcript_20238:826-1785(+)
MSSMKTATSVTSPIVMVLVRLVQQALKIREDLLVRDHGEAGLSRGRREGVELDGAGVVRGSLPEPAEHLLLLEAHLSGVREVQGALVAAPAHVRMLALLELRAGAAAAARVLELASPVRALAQVDADGKPDVRTGREAGELREGQVRLVIAGCLTPSVLEAGWQVRLYFHLALDRRRQAVQEVPRVPKLRARDVPGLVGVAVVEEVAERGELRLDLHPLPLREVDHAHAIVPISRMHELPQVLQVLAVALGAVLASHHDAFRVREPRAVGVAEVCALDPTLAWPLDRHSCSRGPLLKAGDGGGPTADRHGGRARMLQKA